VCVIRLSGGDLGDDLSSTIADLRGEMISRIDDLGVEEVSSIEDLGVRKRSSIDGTRLPCDGQRVNILMWFTIDERLVDENPILNLYTRSSYSFSLV